mgnify:FL=1
MANLGFVGLGSMGGEMARLLLEAGHSVTGYNRTKSRARWLLDLGMLWGNTPRGVAQAADVTLSMVRDTEALLAVTGGPDGLIAGLGPGKYYIDMSTVSPAASKQLAVQAAEAGAKMFDSPVSGSLVTLKAGQVSFMVGGDQEALEDIRPILQDIGPTVDYVGAYGLAAMMKVEGNLNLPVQILAFSESLLLAEKMGISRELATKVLLNSVVASPVLKYRFPMVLDMPEEPLFDVDMIQKDLNLALDAGAELKVPLPTTAITNQFLNAAQGMGLADKDFVILFDILRRLAGGAPEQ